jgi:hypothetical protein
MVQEHDPPHLPPHSGFAAHRAPGLAHELPEHVVDRVEALRLAVHQLTWAGTWTRRRP